MPVWMQWILALAALAALAPLAAWGARRVAPRSAGLALLLLGFGQAADPPSRHVIEAMDGEEDQAPKPGDPPEV